MTQSDLFDQPIPEAPETLTFNQAMTIFRELHWGRKKMATKTGSFERYMIGFFDGRLIHGMGRLDCEQLRHHLTTTRGLKVSTVNKAHMILALLFSKLGQWQADGVAGGYDFTRLKMPRSNPGKAVKMPKVIPDQPFHDPFVIRRYIRLARQMGEEGLSLAIRLGWIFRVSPIDLWELNDAEINEERMEIRIWRRHTKTERTPQGALQIIKLTESAWGAINRAREFRKPGETRIFTWTEAQRRRKLRRLRTRAKKEGLPGVNWLDLRRGAGGYLDEKGFDVRDRKDALGHTNEKTTITYYSKRVNPRGRRFTEELEKVL
jgi:integrase